MNKPMSNTVTSHQAVEEMIHALMRQHREPFAEEGGDSREYRAKLAQAMKGESNASAHR